MSNKIIKVYCEQEKNIRLDKFLAGQLPDITRSKIQYLIKNSLVSKADKIIIDLKYQVQPGESFYIQMEEVKTPDLLAKEIPLNIIYEDQDLIVINKPAGLTTHPGAGNHDDTLVNGLIAHYKNNLSSIGGSFRPGIVHRLDKDTSGLLLIAKNDMTHAKLSQDLAERNIKRTYQALVWGIPAKAQDTIIANIERKKQDRKKMTVVGENSGKIAITHYKILKVFMGGKISLIECSLETGRTHQIRVHMQHINHPIVGDQVYGLLPRKKKFSFPQEINDAFSKITRQMLHAKKLSLQHPIQKKELDFEIDLPQDMANLIMLIS
jgi:23S rRNA pseudouridine1911/1915/1917 synthase